MVRFAVSYTRCGCEGAASAGTGCSQVHAALAVHGASSVEPLGCCWVTGLVWEPSGGHQGCGQVLVEV